MRVKKFLYFIGGWAGWLGTTSSLVFGYAAGTDTTTKDFADSSALFTVPVIFIEEHAFTIWVWIAAFAVGGFILRRIGEHWVWDKLKYILDEFQKKAFPQLQHQSNSMHRVTLYRHQQWRVLGRDVLGERCCYIRKKTKRYPWSGWLVPVLRSGHKPLKTNAIFKAPSDKDSEGIGGAAWDSQGVALKRNLQSISSKSNRTTKERYAKHSICPKEMIEWYAGRGKSLPRSIGAIPVYVSGEAWGVLVLDSQDPEGVTDEVLDNFTLTVGVIGQLLEKV